MPGAPFWFCLSPEGGTHNTRPLPAAGWGTGMLWGRQGPAGPFLAVMGARWGGGSCPPPLHPAPAEEPQWSCGVGQTPLYVPGAGDGWTSPPLPWLRLPPQAVPPHFPGDWDAAEEPSCQLPPHCPGSCLVREHPRQPARPLRSPAPCHGVPSVSPGPMGGGSPPSPRKSTLQLGHLQEWPMGEFSTAKITRAR